MLCLGWWRCREQVGLTATFMKEEGEEEEHVDNQTHVDIMETHFGSTKLWLLVIPSSLLYPASLSHALYIYIYIYNIYAILYLHHASISFQVMQ